MKKLALIAVSVCIFIGLMSGIARAEKGKIGIGVGTSDRGLGVRYWASDSYGFDGSLNFSFGGDSTDIGLGTNLVQVIRQTRNLKYLSMYGLSYSSEKEDKFGIETTENSFDLGVGLGVEYSFTELPQLSFEAFVTGVGISMTKEKVKSGGVSSEEKDTIFSTDPGFGIDVRYYLN